MVASELTIGAGVSVVGLLVTLFAYRLTRLNEQVDAIGSTRGPGGVEPAGWNVLAYQMGGLAMAFVGVLVVASVDLVGGAVALLLAGPVLAIFAYRIADVQRRVNGQGHSEPHAWTTVCYRLVGGVATLVGGVMLASALWG